ncbi:MAG: helix-turn-helix domain-containing protein [Chloroflexi bacterium]|nr:helix-turn-helix domain-containing protein [Chloroflexota bacterium]MYC01774.1 helix-turn-helix domain-containing protein [Chloroflexota bacterium]
MTPDKPPTPRRCRRILEAHHLWCQGCSAVQIARRLGCARSTVYAYLRDFRLHREHILRTVAADRLADQLYLLTYPNAQPEQHQRHIATARELRLLLLNLPAIQQPDRPDSPGISRTVPEHSETDSDSSRQIWTRIRRISSPQQQITQIHSKITLTQRSPDNIARRSERRPR